jgi:cysteinyl-tRNA synthetase
MLLMNGHAYESEGHVLFDVGSYPAHGALSGHDQANLGEHNRIEAASYKRHPADFVLWKPSTWDQPGWDASFGRGRPGWHIECSAMIENIFAAQTIDIHGGGGDLRFPHHDCENSQYACSHHQPDRKLANYWLHNGMLLVDREKMAKSAGNFFTVQSLIDRGWKGEEIRLALLMTHYRSPLDWKGEDNLKAARTTLEGWRDCLLMFKFIQPTLHEDIDYPDVEAFYEALADDLNTPLAITALHRLMGLCQHEPNNLVRAAVVKKALDVLGLLSYFDRALNPEMSPEAARIMEKRQAARAAGNYSLSDALRDDLKALGIHVKDQKDASPWWYA